MRPTTGPLTYFLSLLGGFDLRLGEAPLTARGSGQRLLALLAVAGRRHPVSRTAVIDRLWGDDPRRSTARLRTTLWRLPSHAERPLVVASASTLRLADEVIVDLWHAERDAKALAGRGPDAHRARPELDGFTDDLLPDWSDEWLVLEREAFRQTRLYALEHASKQLCAQGCYQAALEAARLVVTCEPLRETARCLLVEAHLAEGNHAEALRQYQIYRRTLAAELGLAPSPVIRALVGPLLHRPADRPSHPV